MIIYNIEQHSEAWHEIRCGRVTGTRFKTLVSGESTQGYKDLVLEIAGEIITGEKEDTFKNDIMERGTELEPDARAEYESLFDVSVSEVGFITPREELKYSEWIGISPDGVIMDSNIKPEGLTEFKCPLRKTHLKYIRKGILPTEYKWQVQGQLFVTGVDYCDFMSYYPKMKPFIIRVRPDLAMFETIRQRLDKLIEDVKNELDNYKNYKYLDYGR